MSEDSEKIVAWDYPSVAAVEFEPMVGLTINGFWFSWDETTALASWLAERAAIAPRIRAAERECAAKVCEASAERSRAVQAYFPAIVAETLAAAIREEPQG